MTDVTFDGLVTSLEEVQENPARFAARLERAKRSPGFAECICQSASGGKPLRLVVRRYGALFHLARWPEEGTHHNSKTCSFFAEATESGASAGDEQDAIRSTPAGLNARLDVSLTVRTVGTVKADGTAKAAGRSTSRRTAPLLGFLQRVWQDAGLNQWSGGLQRNWGTCSSQILAVLGEGKINGKPIQDVVHVMRRYEESEQATIKAEFDSFLNRIRTTPTASDRGVVIAEVKSIDPSKYGFILRLRQTFETFYASKQLVESAARSFRHAWPMIGKAEARIVAVLVIERTKDDNLRAIDLALQLCNRSFIPCDSSYEVDMANRLVEERRRFLKPIRRDDADKMLPDFRLLDTTPPTAIEVYGMESNDAYRARKTEKQALYARSKEPCVEWVPPSPLGSVMLPPAT
ncbi:DUF1173 family protein [Paraburkholderia dioscoreae]|uniref:DUF1173 domain-containing protein n=1 Tax=Paraburkholderia dioscoreae TaxID=2604047 RepID=A0A5Q4Z9V3_9BURK|nr:DUF1173 family protein [Paraburkholderia dioscoreae]VVD31289.1 conserved protein of unknown function [Paraburkholderia dioscoreae]